MGLLLTRFKCCGLFFGEALFDEGAEAEGHGGGHDEPRDEGEGGHHVAPAGEQTGDEEGGGDDVAGAAMAAFYFPESEVGGEGAEDHALAGRGVEEIGGAGGGEEAEGEGGGSGNDEAGCF